MGLGLPLLITGLGAWLLAARSDSLARDADLERRMEIVEQRLNGLAADMSAHNRNDQIETRLADAWRQRIVTNEQRLTAIMTDVAHCTDFKDRCAAVEQRVDKLRRRLDEVTDKVRELDAGVKALRPGRHR
jgi:predicted  nucleic acid-binding Zn-ribbon protein